jgi:LmbE family N-acetylglucosaminyl deacetylase
MKVLVVAAHPDDEVLGCGGTIARLTREGHDVYVAILGEGITSRYDKREEAERALVENLHTCSQQVAKLLGAKDLFLYHLPDNRFDTLPLLDLIKIIEKLVHRLKPQVVYTHHGGDLNIDHTVVHRAVVTATRPVLDFPVKELYAFEIPSSTEWSFGQFQFSFRPNVFVDINSTLEIKLQCMQIYENEIQSFPHPRSPETLRAIAQRWGTTVGLKAAESFELIRVVR